MSNRFVERLNSGEPVICAEGYLFELERRGYVQIGPFVPEVVLTDPDVVKQLHREFVRAGSDVVEAFTYYGHRTKLRLIGKEHLLEDLNRGALKLAREVIEEFPGRQLFLAGNICNTTVYDPSSPASIAEVRAMFTEQVNWAAEAQVDLIIGETFEYLSEALLALEVINSVSLPAVITLAIHQQGKTRDGYDSIEALELLSKNGAAVVGFNCARGPSTMLPLMQQVASRIKTPLAALPVGYNTNEEFPTMQSFSTRDKKYTDLDPHTCTRYDFGEFAKNAKELGFKYIGCCCGGAPHHVRAMAEALGRTPESSRFSADLSLHFAFGKKEVLGELSSAQNFSYGEIM
eukprot:TRINITY_DN1439_c0_g1_i1.p1 TRINITY_DN1439_c0_g1~~TRINITY_DN1439_c0_g1_i1.p1  ORF type:complete len:359 (+),score=104.82 TRINITY_DN1439_c0_g1_i1:41-1078(+)